MNTTKPTMKCGDNKTRVHKMKVLLDTNEVVVGYCEYCKHRDFSRKDKEGRPEPKYGKIYKRDTLQPSSNLYYKEYKGRMNTL